MKILFLLLLLIPIFEIITIMVSLNMLGFINSIFVMIITFIVGFYLFLKSKKNFLNSEVKSYNQFNFNTILFKDKKFPLFMLFGSILLIIPGYISDACGILLMIKPVQNFLVSHTIKSLKIPFGKNNFYTNSDTETVEGEYYNLHNDKSNLTKK